MKKYFKSIFTITILFIVNCATPPPARINNEASIIAINIGLTVHTGLLEWQNFKPEKIYFIKIDNKNSLKAKEVIESNYYIESWIPKVDRITSYLMNAKPGTYAAVAAIGTTYEPSKSPISSNSKKYKTSIGNFYISDQGDDESKQVFVFFPTKVITSSIVTVQPNSMVYMGTFFLNSGDYFNGMGEADELQKYYYNLFYGAFDDLNLIIKYLILPQCIAPQEKEIYNSDEFKKEFIKNQINEFKNTEWKGLIKKK